MSLLQDKRLEAEVFDRLVESGGGHFDPFHERAYENLVSEFVRRVRPRAGARLLDVGCGTGAFTRRWAELGLEVYGLDLSEVAVRSGLGASSRASPAAYAVADAERLPAGTGSVDYVTFCSVLHHMPAFAPAVREAFRVLRPGGACFAFDPNVYAPVMFLLRHPASPLYTPDGVSPQERPLRPQALRQAFEGAGFRVVQRCRAALPYRSVGPRWARPLLPLYNRVDALIERIGLGRLIGPFVITVGTKPA